MKHKLAAPRGASGLGGCLEKHARDPVSTPVWIDEEGGDPPHLQVGRENRMPMHRDDARRRAPFVGDEQDAGLVLNGPQAQSKFVRAMVRPAVVSSSANPSTSPLSAARMDRPWRLDMGLRLLVARLRSWAPTPKPWNTCLVLVASQGHGLAAPKPFIGFVEVRERRLASQARRLIRKRAPSWRPGSSMLWPRPGETWDATSKSRPLSWTSAWCRGRDGQDVVAVAVDEQNRWLGHDLGGQRLGIGQHAGEDRRRRPGSWPGAAQRAAPSSCPG
jgi:hypothetical protein